MSDATAIRLAETRTVPFGPDSFYQLLVGDDAGNTPVRVGIHFRVVGDRVLRIMGIHASPQRIVRYRDGRATDARGYPGVEA